MKRSLPWKMEWKVGSAGYAGAVSQASPTNSSRTPHPLTLDIPAAAYYNAAGIHSREVFI